MTPCINIVVRGYGHSFGNSLSLVKIILATRMNAPHMGKQGLRGLTIHYMEWPSEQ